MPPLCPPVLLLERSCLGELGMFILGWPGPPTRVVVWCLHSALSPPAGAVWGPSPVCPGRVLLSFPSPWSQLGHAVKAAGSACPSIHHSPLAAPAPPARARTPCPRVPLQQRCMNVPLSRRELVPPQTPDVFFIYFCTFYNTDVEKVYLTAK